MMTFRGEKSRFFKKSYFQYLNVGNQSYDHEIKILEALRIWMIKFSLKMVRSLRKYTFFDKESQKWPTKLIVGEFAGLRAMRMRPSTLYLCFPFIFNSSSI